MGVCKDCMEAVIITDISHQPPCSKCQETGKFGNVVVDNMAVQFGSLRDTEYGAPSFNYGDHPICDLRDLAYLPPPSADPQ